MLCAITHSCASWHWLVLTTTTRKRNLTLMIMARMTMTLHSARISIALSNSCLQQLGCGNHSTLVLMWASLASPQWSKSFNIPKCSGAHCPLTLLLQWPVYTGPTPSTASFPHNEWYCSKLIYRYIWWFYAYIGVIQSNLCLSTTMYKWYIHPNNQYLCSFSEWSPVLCCTPQNILPYWSCEGGVSLLWCLWCLTL